MRVLITLCLIFTLFSSSLFATDPIIWPMQPQDDTHTLWHSYGDFCTEIWEVGPDYDINFHAGVDLTDPTPFLIDDPAEDVYCVREGYVTFVGWEAGVIPDPPMAHDNYTVVISDFYQQSTGYGWCYTHIEDHTYTGGGENDNPWSTNELFPGNDFAEGTRIGDIDNDAFSQSGTVPGPWTADHLHFMRSAYEYDPAHPGYCNPLYYLIPEPAQNPPDFTWTFHCDPTLPYAFFVLPQYDAAGEPGWISQWADSLECIAEIDEFQDNIHGAVDLIAWFYVEGVGQNGSYPKRKCMPQRLEWWLERWDPVSSSWYEVQDITGSTYRRFPFDFGDIELGHASDWQKYRQLYFRWWLNVTNTAYYCCLTNCSDAEDWNGIQNITENYWQTDVQKDLSEPTNHPALQLTPDGPSYRVAIQPYVFDGAANPPLALSPAYAELELHNSSPIVGEGEILDESKAVVWDAGWEAVETTRGLEAELVINANESVQLDQTLTATVVFSEPMNTSTIDITAGKPPYFNDLTVTTTGWSCTNNPEPYYDTWHGTIEVPAEGISGAIKLCIDGEDTDGNCLKDPAGAFTDEMDDYSDTYHGFGIAFSSEEGWPVFLEHWVNGSPALGDFDGDGDLDIAVQSNKGIVELIDEDGNILRTLPSGDWSGFHYHLFSSPAVADLDLDGDMDVLAVHPYGCNAWDAEAGYSLLGWPVNMGYAFEATGIYPSHSAPAVCDLIGDAHPEVVICRHLDLTQPYAICTVWMFDYLGNKIWQRELETGGVSVASTAAVGDISSIHSGNEILVCTSDGFVSNFPPPDGGKDWNSAVYLLDPSDGSNIWKTSFNCWFYASPVIGDIDDDGINEVIVGSHLGTQWKRVFVLDGDYGTLEHTFYVSGTVVNSAAICDLNGDGILDIVAVDNTGHVYCWSGEDFSDGNQYDPLPGFPVEVTGIPTSPSIADIDGDFKLEIVIGTGDGYLYAINHDGSICSGYPVTVPELSEITGQPVIANLDNDDSLELMFADGSDSYAYCYDLGVKSFPAEMPWRQFQHDSWHTGCFEVDNTIPEPPTNLGGEITYTTSGCEVDLWWDLSVNDPYSSSPQEPTDVICYGIMRAFPPHVPFSIIDRVHAGVGSYVDRFNILGPVVTYAIIALDGTNESEYSNYIKFPTYPSAVISHGCSVIEEFSDERASIRIPEITEHRITEELSHAERRLVSERTSATVPTATLDAVLSGGNPGCLTDGNTEVCYVPSPGADAVVIDLGEECTVTSVIPERVSGIFLDVSSLTDEYVRTLETTPVVEPYLLIEVAGSDREFYPFLEESWNSTETVRYVRIRGASGHSEITVYGSRGTDNGVSTVEITRSVENEGWMFAIPVMEYSEEASVNIYDISGRMIWSGHAESGSVLYWDGYTGDRTPVPNGVYLLHCSIGSEVSTGSFVVRRD